MLKHQVTPARTADQSRSVSVAVPMEAVTPATIAPLYLRASQVVQLVSISKRTLSNWQRARRIRFYKVGKTVLFRRCDIETCIEKFTVHPVGEVKPRKTVRTGTITSKPAKLHKRRAIRITPPPTKDNPI